MAVQEPGPDVEEAYWTAGGYVYHTDPDCESIANPNTHDLEHGRPDDTDRRLCQHCRFRDNPPRIVQAERDGRDRDVREWLEARGITEFCVRRGQSGGKTLHPADADGEPVCGYEKPVRWRVVDEDVYPAGYYPVCTACLLALHAADGGGDQ